MDYGGTDTAGYVAFFAFLAVYLAFIALYLVIIVAAYVVNALFLMQLFRKVGVERWAAWVPIFNYWRQLELGGFPGWVALGLLLPVANYASAVFIYIAMYRTGIAFRKDGSYVLLAIFLPFVWALLLARETEQYYPEVLEQQGWQGPFVGAGARPPVPGSFI
jgi:hypothetical protein